MPEILQEFLSVLIQAIVTVSIPIISTFVIQLLRAKAEQVKTAASNDTVKRYINEAANAVGTSVLYVSQTFVDALKTQDKWTKENQVEALNIAIRQAKALLSDEAANFLANTYGDITKWLKAQIEAEVNLQKS